MSRLAELPVDTLKIDRSFVARLPRDQSGTTLVQTIVHLARAFKLSTVAYLMSKAVSRDAFASLIEHGGGHMSLPAE